MTTKDIIEQKGFVVGIKQVKKLVNDNNCKVLYIAIDADTDVTNEVIDLCKEKHIEIKYVDTMKELRKNV